MTAFLTFYIILTLVFSAYGLYQALMLVLYFRQRRKTRSSGEASLSSLQNVDTTAVTDRPLPVVTVQLPVYNERYVVRRIIDAVVNFDYPRDRLQIQVLDDSTDDSLEIGRDAVEYHRSRGVNISLIHRENRKGFKAGALAEGLKRAEGEFIAVFDADFIPAPNFLKRLIVEHRVFDNPKIGFAQTRWLFINRHESWLTRGQSILHDMHFFIDQPARSRNNLFFNFNGSGGIWRRACIEDAGGWSADTLAEDLDLSYRAEFRGWRGVYFLTETSPNELPTTMTAFKRQQTRWARGSIQCARKLVPRAIMTPSTLLQKISATMHMANYSMHLVLVLFILLYPAVLYFTWRGMLKPPLWLGFLSPLCLSYLVALFVPQVFHKKDTGCTAIDIFMSIGIGVGVSVSNAIAVLKGLFISESGIFERTPKECAGAVSPIAGESIALLRKHEYRLMPSGTLWAELTMGVYCLAAFFLLIPIVGGWVFPMFMYAAGYFLVAFTQIAEKRKSFAVSVKRDEKSLNAGILRVDDMAPEPSLLPETNQIRDPNGEG